MSRTGPFKVMVAAVLSGLLFTSLVSIGWVKAAHNFPRRAAVTGAYVAEQFQTSPYDHLALLIANSNYPDADAAITAVTAGVDSLGKVLRSHGFLVTVVRDATRAGMTEAVDRLKSAARPGSIVLVYFGGFGVQSEGQNFMIPVDANIWQERDVRRDGVNIGRVLSDLSASGARTRAIVDASRRNPYERRFRSYSHGLAPIDAEANTIVITSTSPEQVVDDADASSNRLVNDLAAEIRPTSRSVEEVFAERAATGQLARTRTSCAWDGTE
jgi:uncharacterized caspase-like protein